MKFSSIINWLIFMFIIDYIVCVYFQNKTACFMYYLFGDRFKKMLEIPQLSPQ